MSCHWLIAGSDLFSFDVEALPETSNSVLAQISFGSDVRGDQNFVIPELGDVVAATAAQVSYLKAECSVAELLNTMKATIHQSGGRQA